MAKALLLTIVYAPVMIGVLAATSRSPSRGLRLLLAAVIGFDVFYALFLYYGYLRMI